MSQKGEIFVSCGSTEFLVDRVVTAARNKRILLFYFVDKALVLFRLLRPALNCGPHRIFRVSFVVGAWPGIVHFWNLPGLLLDFGPKRGRPQFGLHKFQVSIIVLMSGRVSTSSPRIICKPDPFVFHKVVPRDAVQLFKRGKVGESAWRRRLLLLFHYFICKGSALDFGEFAPRPRHNLLPICYCVVFGANFPRVFLLSRIAKTEPFLFELKAAPNLVLCVVFGRNVRVNPWRLGFFICASHRRHSQSSPLQH